jgi:hypothetical protein
MQARLEIRRFPRAFVAFVLALAAALLLGGSLGYVLKPTTTVSGPSPTVVISSGQLGGASDNAYACDLINRHPKVC